MAVDSALSSLSYLVIEPNSSCNLKCITCNRLKMEKDGYRKAKNLSSNEFLAMLDQLEGAPIDTIKFEGLSEPMLHPQFDVLSKILRERYPKAFVIIATNLQYQISRTPFLDTLPYVDMVYLSIDGVEGSYEKARAGAKYTKLLKSLQFLKDQNFDSEQTQKLQINMTVTPENIFEIPKVYELKQNYNLGGVRLNLAQNWNQQEKYPYVWTNEMLIYLRSFRKDIKGVPNWKFSDCFWPHSATVIDVFGDVRQCLLKTDQKPLGNIFEQPLKEIFSSSPSLCRSRRDLEANQPGESCLNCSYKSLAKPLSYIFENDRSANAPRAWKNV